MGIVSDFSSCHQLGVNIRLTHLLSYELCKKALNDYFSYSLPYSERILTPPKVAKVTGHLWRWEWFHDLVHAIRQVWYKYQVDMPPMQEGALFPLFSPMHTVGKY